VTDRGKKRLDTPRSFTVCSDRGDAAEPATASFADSCTDFSVRQLAVTHDRVTPSHTRREEAIAETLSFALRFKGRRRFPQSHSLMADITAVMLPVIDATLESGKAVAYDCRITN
jgi:hypothetical protein